MSTQGKGIHPEDWAKGSGFEFRAWDQGTIFKAGEICNEEDRVSGLAIIPHGGCSEDFITREDLTASSSSRAMI
jgi:hypothetical protein